MGHRPKRKGIRGAKNRPLENNGKQQRRSEGVDIPMESDSQSLAQFADDRMGGSLLQHTSTTNKSYADWSIPAFFQSWFERIPSVQSGVICEGLLPPYIKPLPAHLQREDVEYLVRKGALYVPDSDLHDELLRCYIEFVPGSLPEPDWHEVLTHVEGRHSPGGGLSLLLFQAIMFAASAYIDLEYLKRAGFKTRISARRVFFQRVRLLYDFDYEKDRICVVQSLLLMTYWYETPDDQKDSWHWMGLALSVASTIGLDRDTEQLGINEREKRLRRRLWWSCVMRDPIVAIGMRRPTHIKKSDHNVSMLTLDDFDTSAIPADTSPISARCSMARDSKKQCQRAILCIEKAKLCQIMANILSVQYDILDSSANGTDRDHNSQSTAVLMPIRHEPNVVEFNRCDEDLKSWLEKLPPEAKYVPLNPSGPDEADCGLALIRAMNHLIYSAAVIALHRPRSLFTSNLDRNLSNPHMPPPVQASRANVRHAATDITSILRELYQHGLSRHLPLTALNAVLPAMLSHLAEVQTRNGVIQDGAREAYADCMLVLEELRNSHTAADISAQFLAIVAHRVGTLNTESIQQPNCQMDTAVTELLSTADVRSALCTMETPPADQILQSGTSLQSRSNLAEDYTNICSPRARYLMGNSENAQLDPFSLPAHDDPFNLGEVDALFSPWTGLDFLYNDTVQI